MLAFAALVFSAVIAAVSASAQKAALAVKSLNLKLDNAEVHQFDVDGNIIGLTSGQIDYLDGRYVWYGVDLSCGTEFCGILSYSSNDMTNWVSNGYMFPPNSEDAETICAQGGNCGRPHIVYSENTQLYNLWVNAGAPGYPIWTSSNPTSGYTFKGRASIAYQPPAHQGGDFAVENINGVGYIVYSSIDFSTLNVQSSIWPPFVQTLYAQQLNADMDDTVGDAYPVRTSAYDLVDQNAESPAIFQRGKFLYVGASDTCGFCNGTLAIMYRATSFKGPWTRQILDATTCGGQIINIQKLPDARTPKSDTAAKYIFESDTFSSAPVAINSVRTSAHGHGFFPLSFNDDGSIDDLKCGAKERSTVRIIPGTGVNENGDAIAATDSSGRFADYTYACDLGQRTYYQTYSPSKTGKLATFSFNVAQVGANGPLTATVFRYTNDSVFLDPFVQYETLYTTNIAAADIPSFGNLATIKPNVNVKRGDRLALLLANQGGVPLCVFQRTGAPKDQSLWAIGTNQVSPRGHTGKASPVFKVGNRAIKFQTTIT